jgi:hypothetical protein
VNISKARSLLRLARAERERLTRHLLVAAALREVLSGDPIVVGGTAEEYWTAAEYHETDLDLCAYLTREDRAVLTGLGFRREGRHWTHPRINVAAEFPGSRIDGDEARTIEVPVGPGAARVIGLDDLYLDRLRQATIDERREGVEFQAALAVVAARYEDIDWPYVRGRIEAISDTEGSVGGSMRRLDSKIRRRVRARLGPI